MSRIEEIETRIAEIKEAMTAEDVDLDALNAETDSLIEERKGILADVEKREKEIAEIVSGESVIDEKEIVKMEQVREYGIDSVEYRNAFLNKMRGVELSEVEQRAYSTNNGAIATMTANDIMSVVRDSAPLLDKLTVIRTGAQIKYYIEGTVNPAQAHTENGAITPDADTVTPITLTPAEITKMVQISESVKQMSVDAFEAWVAKVVGEAIARKINALIVTAITPSVPTATAFSAANVQLLLGSVKGKVTLVANKKTLYTKLLPLQDNSKTPIVRFEGKEATVYGCPVMVDDNASDGVVIAGDLSKAAAALAEDVKVVSQFDINTNSYKYLGVALFDVKVGIASAFASIDDN